MHVAMIGTGYVGLVSGACFADFGHIVTCIDKDAGKIERLQAGGIPIYEPGLDVLVAQNVKAGRLFFTTDAAEAVKRDDAVFIGGGTPARRADVAVVSNPEFLREGAAIEDFKRPDRVVVGTDDERARALMREIYRPLYLNETPIQFTGRRTSELIKYAGNAFLAMKITFINEIADLCEAVDADVQQVSRGIGLDNRIGGKFLHAGPGYGGSCFPKDTLALVRTARDSGAPVELIETTVKVNDARKKAMSRKVITAVNGQDLSGYTIGVLGLTFKPNSDDMRDAPSLDIVPALQAAGAAVQA